MALVLTNPHSVLAVLETRPQDILEIHFPSSAVQKPWGQVRSSALKAGVRSRKDRKGGSKDGTVGHGRRDRETAPAGLPGTALFQRLGSRTLVGLGWRPGSSEPGRHLQGFRVLRREGHASDETPVRPPVPTVYDVASGGVEYVPFSVQTNLSRALDLAKARGLWILGTSEHAETDLAEIDRDRPWLLLLGREDRGLRTLSQKKCDTVCKIPSKGRIASLNVSAAAAIFIHRLSL